MAVSHKLLAGVTVGLLLTNLGVITWADDKNDLLERAAREREVARQAFVQQIDADLAKADKESDRAKAAELLKDLRKKIDDDYSHLGIVQKIALKASIKERLERLETAKAGQTTKTGNEPVRAGNRDDEAVRTELDRISDLRKSGDIAGAQRAAEALAKRYPNHAVARQVNQNLALADRISEAGRVARDQGEGRRLALNSVSKSATPIPGDIQYPSNWAEIDKRKEKYRTGATLTDKEKAILASLATVVDERIELKEQPLEKVLEFLQKLLGSDFRVDKKAIEELQLTYETPISVSLPRGLTKRTVARRILGDVGLAYIIKEERIEVTSAERANKEVTTQTYQIDDLLGLSDPTTFRFGGAMSPPRMDATARFLIEMIQSQVEPNSWDKNGGPGSITYFAATRTLIVRNTAEVHAMMGIGSKKKK